MRTTKNGEDLRKKAYPTSLLHWFFLVWLSSIYLWEVVIVSTATLPICAASSHGKCLETSQIAHVSWPSLLIVTLLMLFSSWMLWMSLRQKTRRRPRSSLIILSFVIQGIIILALGLVVPGDGAIVSLSLSLALILAASLVFDQIQIVIVIACSYFILCTALFVLAVIPKSGFISWSGLVQVILLDVAPLLFGIGYLLLYNQLAGAYAQLEVTHQELVDTVEQVEALTQLTERQRLARELHDTLAQGLTGVIILIQGAHLHLTQRHYSQAEQVMQTTARYARETLSAARATIDNLYTSSTSPEKSIEALQEDIARFTDMTGIPCISEGLSLLMLLPDPRSEIVRRMINEGLTNIVRHSQAQHAWVRLRQDEAWLTIEIQDDGIGFDPTEIAQTGHYGLLGLQERTRFLDGRLEIVSEPGRGTLLQVGIRKGAREVQHG